MATSRRKQEERNLRILREQGALEANRTCFDCRQRGTTYINMTIGSFVCTSCSGLLRGLNPPHRVKSISMASFTQEEIDLIKSRGNQYCSAVWLGLHDTKLTPFPDTKDEHKIRDFMITKYEKKRFYIDPSVALKIMPQQDATTTSTTATTTSSAPSSAASTPGSDSAGRGGAGGANNTSVSRPSVPASQSLGSVSSSGSSLSGVTSPPPNNNNNNKLPGPRPSASLDLLSDLGQSSRPATNPGDPFASPTGHQAPPSQTQAVSQPSFANFENANIFMNTPTTGATATASRPTPPGPHLPFSSNPLTPLTPHSSTSSSTPNTNTVAAAAAAAAAGNPPQDRYAALKDLDEEFKTQKESETSNGGVSWAIPNGGGPHHTNTTAPSASSAPNNPTSTSVFGPSNVNGSVFGSPPGGVFGGGVNGGAPVMGTPPTAPSPWQAFSGANPFSGVNNGAAWVNGGAAMSAPGPTQQGFGTMVQPNPFGTPDPNFNQFGGGAALNGAGPGPGQGGGWANFPPNPAQPSKMAWGAANGTPNPFMAAAPQMPSSGSSYNPFL